MSGVMRSVCVLCSLQLGGVQRTTDISSGHVLEMGLEWIHYEEVACAGEERRSCSLCHIGITTLKRVCNILNILRCWWVLGCFNYLGLPVSYGCLPLRIRTQQLLYLSLLLLCCYAHLILRIGGAAIGGLYIGMPGSSGENSWSRSTEHGMVLYNGRPSMSSSVL